MLTFQLSPKIKTKRKNIDTFHHAVEVTLSIQQDVKLKLSSVNQMKLFLSRSSFQFTNTDKTNWIQLKAEK